MLAGALFILYGSCAQVGNHCRTHKFEVHVGSPGWGAGTAEGWASGSHLHINSSASAAFDTSFRRVNPSYRPEPMRFQPPSRPIESLEPAAAHTGHHVVAQAPPAPIALLITTLAVEIATRFEAVRFRFSTHTPRNRGRTTPSADISRDQTHKTT